MGWLTLGQGSLLTESAAGVQAEFTALLNAFS